MSILLENKQQFFEIQQEIYNSFLKKLQDQNNDKIYPNKNPSDKITCIVCGGHYTRSKKCVHDKSKKHLAMLDECYNQLNSFK